MDRRLSSTGSWSTFVRATLVIATAGIAACSSHAHDSATSHVSAALVGAGNWTASASPPTTLSPAIVVYHGAVYIFTVAADNSAHYATYTDTAAGTYDPKGWSAWSTVPGGVATNRALVAAVLNDKLYVLAGSTAGTIQLNAFDGNAWSGWSAVALSGQTNPGAYPVAATVVGGTLSCLFAADGYQATQLATFDGSSWTPSLWTDATSPIAAATSANNLVIVGADATTMAAGLVVPQTCNSDSGPITCWKLTKPAGLTDASYAYPTALTATAANGFVYVDAVGYDKSHYEDIFDGTSWSGWHGRDLVAALPIVPVGYNNRLLEFVTGDDKSLYVSTPAAIPSGSACAGAWQYTSFSSPCHLTADPRCGDNPTYPQIPVANTCTYVYAYWDSAAQTPVGRHTVPTQVCTQYDIECPSTVKTNATKCTKVCVAWKTVNVWVNDDNCGPAVDTFVKQQQAHYDGILATSGDHIYADAVSLQGTTCYLSLHRLPSITTQTDASHCGTHLVDDLSHPIHHYQTCDLSNVACESNASTQISDVGLKYSDIRSSDPMSTPEASCLRCSDLAENNAAAAERKYRCYRNTYQNAVGGGDPNAGVSSFDDLVGYAVKHVGSLSESEIDQLMGAITDPSRVDTSVPGLVPPSAVNGSSCHTSAVLDNLWNLCVAVLPALSATDANNAPVFDRCLSLTQYMSALAATSDCRDAYLDAQASLAGGVIGQELAGLTHGDSDISKIRAALATIQYEYAAEKQLFVSDAVPRDHLWADSGRLVKVVWDAVHADGLPSQVPLPPPGADMGAGGGGGSGGMDTEALVEAARRDLDDDRRVVRAAFDLPAGTAPPLTTAPLLYVVVDSLHSAFDRADQTAELHDFACRYLVYDDHGGAKDANGNIIKHRCTEAGYRPQTQLTQLLALYALLPDGTAFASATSAASTFKAEHADWWALFNAISVQHGALDSAVADALYPADVAAAKASGSFGDGLNGQLVELTPASRWTAPVTQLMTLVGQGRQRNDGFVATGYFSGHTDEHLSMGIQESRQGDIALVANTLLGTLNGLIGGYTTARDKAANDLMSEINKSGAQASLNAQAAVKLQQFTNVSSDIIGLRARDRLEEARFGDFAAAFAAAIKRPDTDLNRPTNQKQYSINPSAADAHFSPGYNVSLASIAIPDANATGGTRQSLSGKRGDLITIDASGTWMPNCAFHNAQLAPPLDKLSANDDPQTGSTGPEGYQVTLNNSQYQNQSVSQTQSDDSSQSDSTTLKVCGGVDVYAGFDFYGNGVKAYVSVEGCMATDSTHRTSTSDASSTGQGSEARASMAAAVGVRLPNTPFPSLPAGSLVAVELPPAAVGLSQVRRLHVINSGRNVLMLDADSDVYLVVNDISGCSGDTSKQLSVQITHTQPTDANKLMDAMGQALGVMRGSASSFIDQGHILPNDMSSLRSAATLTLGANVGSLSQYSTSFQELYTAWADKEVSHIERLVDIQQLERQRDQLASELKMLRDEYVNGQEQATLMHVMTYWAFRDVDIGVFRNATDQLVHNLNDYLYPVIHLRYPTVIGTLNQDQSALGKLLDVDWLADPLDTAKTLSQVATSIISTFSNAKVGTPDLVNGQKVILSFPIQSLDHVFRESLFHKASPARSTGVWNELNSDGSITFEVKPEDLILPNGSFSSMTCQSAVPVITSMAIMFVGSVFPGADTLNNANQTATLSMSEHLEIPTPTAMEYYQIDDLGWLPGTMPVGYAQVGNESTNFDARTRTTQIGNGLSPFTRYHVSFQSNDPSRPPWQLPPAVTEIMLVMTVQWTNIPAPGLVWLKPACGN